MNRDLVVAMIRACANHLNENLQESHSDWYLALRLYNSGDSRDNDLSSSKNVATQEYVSDVANGLHGCLSRRS